ncbi:hypothetical protein V5799_018967 [Amblyomma americanum]|uniref:Uncharacterized protein n=1 Tax=Amblyomma americanum TaxID=6943 RepID=A0AAQ4EXP7_AMBAM
MCLLREVVSVSPFQNPLMWHGVQKNVAAAVQRKVTTRRAGQSRPAHWIFQAARPSKPEKKTTMSWNSFSRKSPIWRANLRIRRKLCQGRATHRYL